MKNKIALIFIASIFTACNHEGPPLKAKENTNFFNKGELDDSEHFDELSNNQISESLRRMEEPSLRDTSNKNVSIRLTVFPFYYNDYCIRLDRTKSRLTIVSFKVGQDRTSMRATGLNGLTLKYKSDFDKMDSLYQILNDKIRAFDVFSHTNKTPQKALDLQATEADGTNYILEYFNNGRYIVLMRGSGFLGEKFYDKSDEFLAIVKQLHSFVPPGMIPDYDNAREIEDIRFYLFKKIP